MSEHDALRERVETSLVRAKGISTLLAVLRRVQNLAHDPDASAEELSQVIKSDAALTARLLTLVNSAHFGLTRHVNSVSEALVIAGYSLVRNICSGMMATLLAQGTDSNKGGKQASAWRHSLGTAVIAGKLQKKFSPGGHIDLYTAGLLSNVGRTILEQYFPEEHGEINKMVEAEAGADRLLDAERAVLGVTHAEISFWAAEIWGFDEALAQVIRHHHGPAVGLNVDIVNLAYVLAQAMGVGNLGTKYLTPLLPGLLKRLGLEQERLMLELLRKINVELGMLEKIFKSLEE